MSVKSFLAKNDIHLFNIGTPKVNKLGIVEAIIRSLQMMISLSLDEITTFNEYRKAFKSVIYEYNKRFQQSLKCSPKMYLKRFLSLG